MLSFSNFVLNEDTKKNQISKLFKDLDLKIGLEFEFFNEDFVKNNDIVDSSEEIIALDNLSDELIDLRHVNYSIIRDNLKEYARSKNTSSHKDLLGYKKVVPLLGAKKMKLIFDKFSRVRFSKLEITEMIHHSIFSDVISKFKLKPETLDKTGAKSGQLKIEIYQKYKDTNKFKKFEKILNKARTTQVKKDQVPFSLIKKYYSSPENLPSCIVKPYITYSKDKIDTTRWTIKKDPSISASEGGIEFISPIMNPIEALTDTKQIFDFISKVGHTNSQKNKQCGLHINISMKGEKMKQFDALKFIIFSNEGQISNEKLFSDRQDANFVVSVLKNLKSYISNNVSKDTKRFLNSEKQKIGSAFMNQKLRFFTHKYGSVNTSAYRPNNQTIRRKKDERIEVRFFGGEDYHKKYDVFRRVLGELLHAMNVASDPDKEVKKYYKSLYKIINDVEKKDEN